MSDDGAVRARALDPARSFAVRAPAGSGKTSLLIQRVLALLPTVEYPEQIVAITFTRKAAEEMRARIVEAFALAASPAPESEFARRTWTLARAVLEQDAALGWELPTHPARLRIMTIDALCQSLVRQMPITAGMAAAPRVEDDQRQLYAEAARDAVGAIGHNRALRRPIASALRHLDNDWRKLEALLAEMLARRDQWLPMIGAGSDREILEAGFQRYVNDTLTELREQLDSHVGQDIAALARYAGSNLPDSALAGCEALPGTESAALAQWQAIAALFLTKKGEWRKTINKNSGFPAAGESAKRAKQHWSETVAALSTNTELQGVFDRVQRLPVTLFDDTQWATVNAIVTLLKAATAHLMVLCESSGRTDFTAFSLAALAALGEPERPTDLALSLDYQLRHLLIDEFQDTSVTQYELIRRLTAGWSADEGRTLFLVGDPMQSIYRFRQAEVGLFSRVLEAGRIGSVAIEALTLSANFRSQAGLVDWINDTMPGALLTAGGDPDHFVRQAAQHPVRDAPPVVVHPSGVLDAGAEAETICRTVHKLKQADADTSIAILVRSRTHLGLITSALLDAGIAINAREIKPFVEIPLVADLLALARALLHRADRTAWYAVLRAPWCGATLAALHRLCELAPTLPEALALVADTPDFEAAERERLQRMQLVLSTALAALARERFTAVLEQTWIALGAPALYTGAQATRDARIFFDVTSGLDNEGAMLSAERIRMRLAERFSEPVESVAGGVEIMTVHRAKGLEFDHVIIPGCGRAPRSDQRPLLLLREYIDRFEKPQLLLAPVPHKGQSKTYDYLRELDKRANAAEISRLLYVALTRARQQVHIVGHATQNADGARTAGKNTFLSLLWHQVEASFRGVTDDVEEADEADILVPEIRVPRLDSLPPAVAQQPAPPAAPVTPEFDWAGVGAKQVGTVVHRLLQDYAGAGLHGAATADWLVTARGRARGQLLALGLDPAELPQALTTLDQALATTLASERGQWLFAPTHHDARSELTLGHRDGRVVIDRTFIDNAGIRWIVDFKTGTHSGGALNAWLDSEVERYQPQLERYAAVMAQLEARPIRLGLYFPLLDAWREWAFAAGA